MWRTVPFGQIGQFYQMPLKNTVQLILQKAAGCGFFSTNTHRHNPNEDRRGD